MRAVKQAPKGEVVFTKGGHFDVYPGQVSYDKSLSAMTAFILKHVPV